AIGQDRERVSLAAAGEAAAQEQRRAHSLRDQERTGGVALRPAPLKSAARASVMAWVTPRNAADVECPCQEQHQGCSARSATGARRPQARPLTRQLPPAVQ